MFPLRKHGGGGSAPGGGPAPSRGIVSRLESAREKRKHRLKGAPIIEYGEHPVFRAEGKTSKDLRQVFLMEESGPSKGDAAWIRASIELIEAMEEALPPDIVGSHVSIPA